MSDETRQAIPFPPIPDDASEGTKRYIEELQRVLANVLEGDFHVSGDLTVEGDIIDK